MSVVTDSKVTTWGQCYDLCSVVAKLAVFSSFRTGTLKQNYAKRNLFSEIAISLTKVE
jgi:hypothetical protein